jgi:hypothetical protein
MSEPVYIFQPASPAAPDHYVTLAPDSTDAVTVVGRHYSSADPVLGDVQRWRNTPAGPAWTPESLDAYVTEEELASSAMAGIAIHWNRITARPTTLEGYGITDAYTKAEADGRYAPTSITDMNVAAGAAIAWSKISKAGAAPGDIGAAAAVHPHAWADVSKVGSSLADLATRSAGDLNSGTLADARLSSKVALSDRSNLFTAIQNFQHTTDGQNVIRVRRALDTTFRGHITTDFRLEWGPGGTVPVDTNLYRLTADHLRTDDTFSAANLWVGTTNGGTWRFRVMNGQSRFDDAVAFEGNNSNASTTNQALSIDLTPNSAATNSVSLRLNARAQGGADKTISELIGLEVTGGFKGSSVVTTQYGIKIASQFQGATNWSIYSAGGNSYHAGNFWIGTTNGGAHALYVQGTSFLNGNASFTGRITALSNFFLYDNRENVIMSQSASTAAGNRTWTLGNNTYGALELIGTATSAVVLHQANTTVTDGGMLDSTRLRFQGFYDSDTTTGIVSTAHNFDLRYVMTAAGTAPAGRLAFVNHAGVEVASIASVGGITVGNVTPTSSDNHDLGNGGVRWKELYLSRYAYVNGVAIGTTNPGAHKLFVNGATYLGDRLGIGNTSTASNLILSLTTTGSAQYGLFADPLYGSDAEGSGIAGYFRGRSTAATYTMGSSYGVYVATPIKGAGSTITTNYGLYIESQTAGATNYAIYTAGTAESRFGGDVRVDRSGGGVIVTSPDGLVKRRIGIDNAGNLTATAV